jgi:hypothetical protein
MLELSSVLVTTIGTLFRDRQKLEQFGKSVHLKEIRGTP